MKKAKILWIDLEMTGLDPAEDRILEVAAIATDWDFNEIATFEEVVKVDASLMNNRMVGEFWESFPQTLADLKQNSLNAKIDSLDVENKLIDFIHKYFDDEKVLLGGNSIHQDRRFIRNEWKNLENILHYRMLDVSSWKVVMSEKFKRVYAKPESHRALDDIRGSIEELKFYLKKVKK